MVYLIYTGTKQKKDGVIRIMSVKCELCGKEVASTQALAGHKRFAHGSLDKTKSETIPSTTPQEQATPQVQATQEQVLAQQPKKEPVLEWKFSEGVEVVTSKKMGAGVAFCLQFFLSVIGMAIIQDKLNQVAT